MIRPRGSARIAKSATRPEYVPGVLVLRIQEDVATAIHSLARPAGIHGASVRTASSLPEALRAPFAHLQKTKALREIVPVFAPIPSIRRLAAASAMSVASSLVSSVDESMNEDLRGITLLRLSPKTDLKRLEKDLARTRGVQYCHRVPARWLSGKATPQASSSDPMVNRQWGLRAIRWFDPAVDPSTASGVKVAVLDTGIDATHPEFQGVALGYNHDPASSLDIVGHGTHVAGIIAANANNSRGVAGVCRCDLRVWKIFGDAPADDGEFYVDELMYQRALGAARNAGVGVMNLSIGGSASSTTEEMLFRRLVNAGVTVVAAMGNEYEDGNPIEYPAAYPGVVAVGAVDEADERAEFSNTGKHIAISAPGVNILSCLPLKKSPARSQTKYASWSGTSMATPHVTAAAALILAKNPGLSPKDVKKRLRDSASKIAGTKTQVGAGLLNLAAALT